MRFGKFKFLLSRHNWHNENFVWFRKRGLFVFLPFKSVQPQNYFWPIQPTVGSLNKQGLGQDWFARSSGMIWLLKKKKGKRGRPGVVHLFWTSQCIAGYYVVQLIVYTPYMIWKTRLRKQTQRSYKQRVRYETNSSFNNCWWRLWAPGAGGYVHTFQNNFCGLNNIQTTKLWLAVAKNWPKAARFWSKNNNITTLSCRRFPFFTWPSLQSI